MNVEELAKLSVGELRKKANERLALLDLKDSLGVRVYADQSPILSEAQFYIDEIDRRKQARIARRDLFLELVVILLIGLEIYFGITGGNQQLAVLQKLDTSAGETAKALKTLTDDQEVALTTQKESLQTITSMNAALQAELGLNYLPELNVAYNEASKALQFENKGKTKVYLWGTKADDHKPAMIPEARIVSSGGYYLLFIDDLLREASSRPPKGQTDIHTYEVYLKTEDRRKYILRLHLGFVGNDPGSPPRLTKVQTLSIRLGNW